LIAIASGGDCAASASDLIEPRVRARGRQYRFAPLMAVAFGQSWPPLRAAPCWRQAGTEKRRS